MAAIGRAVASNASIAASALQDPLLTISMHTRVAMAVGIVFLMTLKPGMGESLLAIVIAALIGAVCISHTESHAARSEVGSGS